jgi:hypothetical protein
LLQNLLDFVSNRKSSLPERSDDQNERSKCHVLQLNIFQANPPNLAINRSRQEHRRRSLALTADEPQKDRRELEVNEVPDL